MYLTLELHREADGRYIAEAPDLPGVLAYGATEAEATAPGEALGLRVLAALLRIGWVVKRAESSYRVGPARRPAPAATFQPRGFAA